MLYRYLLIVKGKYHILKRLFETGFNSIKFLKHCISLEENLLQYYGSFHITFHADKSRFPSF